MLHSIGIYNFGDANILRKPLINICRAFTKHIFFMSLVVVVVLFPSVAFQCLVHIIVMMKVSWDPWLVTTVFIYLKFTKVHLVFHDESINYSLSCKWLCCCRDVWHRNTRSPFVMWLSSCDSYQASLIFFTRWLI